MNGEYTQLEALLRSADYSTVDWMPPRLPKGAIVNTGHLQKMTHACVICVEFQSDGAQWFAYSLDGTRMASLTKLPYEAIDLFEDPLEMVSIAEQRLAIGFQPNVGGEPPI